MTRMRLSRYDDYVYDIVRSSTNSNIVYAHALVGYSRVHFSGWPGMKKLRLDPTTDAQRTRNWNWPGQPTESVPGNLGDPSFFYSNNGGDNFPRNLGLPNDTKIWELTMTPNDPLTPMHQQWAMVYGKQSMAVFVSQGLFESFFPTPWRHATIVHCRSRRKAFGKAPTEADIIGRFPTMASGTQYCFCSQWPQ